MSLRHCSTVICWLAVPASGFAADARSTTPAWNWGAQPFSSPFRISATDCTNIRVPTAGEAIAAEASGDVCPINTVAHGYYFGKRATQIAISPRYQWHFSGGRCGPAGSYTGTVTNPNTGEVFPRYRNVSLEPCPRNGYMIDLEAFEDWNYRTDYTVDPNNVYMRCCASAH